MIPTLVPVELRLRCGDHKVLKLVKPLTILTAFLCLLAPAGAQQQLPLPTPLKLPPGLEETLPLSPAGSYFGEAVKIQDCPEDADNPLGLCHNLLFGGMAMFVSPLRGNIHIKFFPMGDNLVQFQITHPGGVRGEDTVERAPLLYKFPIQDVGFTDEDTITSGQLDLTTGTVTNLNYRLCVSGTILNAYKNLNPQLTGCEIWFPGVYGTVLAKFEQRSDGLLDFTFFGSTFAPLGNNQGGRGDDIVRVPLPLCSAPGVCAGIEAPGTTLRPRVRLSTRDPEPAGCGDNCPDIPANTIQVFTASAYHSLMGDRFTHLNLPDLGGTAVGWSHLVGKIWAQFGERQGNFVPVTVWATVPDGFLVEPPPFPFPGFGINMLGVDGKVSFPNYSYVATDRVWVNDPFDLAVGVIDVRTGKSVGDFLYRGLPFQTLFTVILTLNAGRIPTDTFRFQGPASFERGPNGSLVFRYDGGLFLDFSTFVWPTPDYNPAKGFRAGPGSLLEPFFKFQATAGGDTPVVVKSGQIDEVSSYGDPVSLKYSIPCDAPNKSFSFEYTNRTSDSRGGTFRMSTLASVSCTNARGSTATRGDADIVTFTGFGKWSKDSDQHVATVQISTSPDARYFIVQIDGGQVSSADTILKAETTP